MGPPSLPLFPPPQNFSYVSKLTQMGPGEMFRVNVLKQEAQLDVFKGTVEEN